MLFQRPWASLCVLAGSLSQGWGLGLSEHPDIKSIHVRFDTFDVTRVTAN